MEIKKEKLSWIENVAEKSTQIDVALDVIVPDTKPDIRKILQIDANVDTSTCDLQKDRILLCGNVYFNVIYLPEETSKIQSIRVTVPFTDIVAVNGVNQEMESVLNTDILSVNYKIINGRKFSVKSIVEAMLKIKNTVSVEMVSAIEDSAAQVKNTDIELLMRSSRCNKKIEINEKIIVPDSEPAIGEVLNVTTKVNEYTVKLINNKAIIKGDVKLTCTYVDVVNEELASISRVTPFTEIVDIEGVKAEDICNTKIETKFCEYNCEESSGGEIRGVETKSILNVDIFTLRDTKCLAVADCYSMEKNLELTTSSVDIPIKISDVNYDDALKTTISVENDAPLVERVYDVFSKAYIDNVSAKQGKVQLNGVVDNYVLYVTKNEETPIYCLKNEIEFSKEFDCENFRTPTGEFVAEVTGSSYALSSDNSIDLRVNLKICGVVYGTESVQVITDVKSTEICQVPETASITVCFVQENETLWDIAKKYFTTIDAITKINEISENEIKKGTRLLIPKYKRV